MDEAKCDEAKCDEAKWTSNALRATCMPDLQIRMKLRRHHLQAQKEHLTI
jgi:hypothetical protein